MKKLSIKKKLAIVLSGGLIITAISGYGVNQNSAPPRVFATASSTQNLNKGNKPTVYMTSEITPESLMQIYKALEVNPTGRIAVKITTGEPPNSNYLKPELIKDLVQSLKGTLVETNTAYAGSRASNAKHRQVAKDHGFTAIANFDLQDADGSISLPVAGGEILKENFVGKSFTNYDYYIVLSHFKGHQLAGYGGAIKNISIGIASATGKAWIHSGGKSKTNPWGGAQDDFLKAMAESGKSVVDSLNGNILYINVMNRLSVDCDCNGNPAEPDMHDIGILASLDPVALDRACIDLVQAAPDGKSLMERINSKNGTLTLDHAAKIGLGSLEYNLVNINNKPQEKKTKTINGNYAAPAQFNVTKARDGAIRLSWTKRSGFSYEVQWSENRVTGFKRLGATSKNSVVKSGLEKDKTYYFRVRAYRTIGEVRVLGKYSQVKSAIA